MNGAGPDSKLMTRVLHALRDMKRRVEEAESRCKELDRRSEVAVVAVIADVAAQADKLSDLCRRDTAVFSTSDDPRLARIAAACAVSVVVRGGNAVYAAHLILDGIAHGQFSQVLLATAIGTSCEGILFKSMDRTIQDGDIVIATVTESAASAADGPANLVAAIHAACNGAKPVPIASHGISLLITGANRSVGTERILEIASEVLHLPLGDEIKPDVPLFEYGLDSLGAGEIRTKLQKETGLPLPITLMFEYSTVETVAAYLRELQPPAAKSEVPPASANGPYPLSRGQSALWAVHCLDPASPAYNLRFAVELDAQTSRELLAQAVRLILQKHPILRARVVETDGELKHIIDPVPADPLDLTESSEIASSSLKPFDLKRGRLARFSFQKKGHVLLIVCHHFVVDFVSMKVLLGELRACYQELAAGAIPAVTPEYDFFNYVQRERARSPEHQADLARRWKEALGENLPVLRPLQGRSRGLGMYRGGREYRSALTSNLSDRIATSAASMSATMYQFMFAAYALALMETVGQDDLVAGTTVSLRDAEAKQDAVGYFVNPLPVRYRMNRAAAWTQFFEAHQSRMVDVLRLRALPFASLVEHLSPRREAFVSPIFQTMFTWLADGDDPMEVTFPQHAPAGVTHDLVLMVRPAGSVLRCTWCYQEPLFTANEIEALAYRYEQLLDFITAHPDAQVQLDLADAEREQIVI